VSLALDNEGNIFGVTSTGGASHVGTVFTIRVDGTGFRLLRSFAGGAADGGWPSSIVLDGLGRMFGTTSQGGTAGLGTLFRMNLDGTGFRILHSFLGGGLGDGALPLAPVVLDGTGNIYGTTVEGGVTTAGTVFTAKSDGSDYRLLYTFQGGDSYPYSSLILADNQLFGTSVFGGLYDRGVVYRLKTDGTGFTWLHSFGSDPEDGASPYSPVIPDAKGYLFGSTSAGGASGLGTLFTLKTDGTRFSLLHTFTGAAEDGAAPDAPLVLDASGYLYGTTPEGGPSNQGIEFRIVARPGDANGDGVVDAADVFRIVDALFAGGPVAFAGGDVNGDGVTDVADAFFLINYLFAGGSAPKN
jgi:uncharacterized repeat protein (TIGR03803 family)